MVFTTHISLNTVFVAFSRRVNLSFFVFVFVCFECDENKVDVVLKCVVDRDNEHNYTALYCD